MEDLARRNLNTVLAAVIETSAGPGEAETVEERWGRALEGLSARSREVYRYLVYEDEDFLRFFSEATPIRELSLLNIGSRPAKMVDIPDVSGLRAIPWIFACTQNRLPTSWYGAGAAYQEALGVNGDPELLPEMYWQKNAHDRDGCYACGSALLIEDVLDLVERIRGKDVSEAQIRRPRVRQGVEGVARYEDGRSRLDGPRFGADLDRAGPFEDEVNLGLPVAVSSQRLPGGHPPDAHGERLAAGDVPADEGSPVNQTLPRDLFVRPRFPLAGALSDDDRFAVHPPTSSCVRGRSKNPYSPPDGGACTFPASATAPFLPRGGAGLASPCFGAVPATPMTDMRSDGRFWWSFGDSKE